MSVNPAHTKDSSGTNPHKGLNVRTFGISIIVALLILLAGAFIFVRTRPTSAAPQENQEPSSRTSPVNGSSSTGHTNPQ